MLYVPCFMIMVDPISDMLTRIRNAQAVKKPEVLIPVSKIKLEIAKILKKEGFVEDIKEDKINSEKLIKISLKYLKTGEPIIQEIQRVSRPGCRIYTKRDKLSKVLGGLGITVISTSRGLMTDKEARRRRLGGEILCKVW